jgi:hypothetical protein
MGGINAVRLQAVEDAGPEVIVSNGADEADILTEACGLVGKDSGRAAGEGPDKLRRRVEWVVNAGTHDLDEGLADGDDCESHGVASVALLGVWMIGSMRQWHNLPTARGVPGAEQSDEWEVLYGWD